MTKYITAHVPQCKGSSRGTRAVLQSHLKPNNERDVISKEGPRSVFHPLTFYFGLGWAASVLLIQLFLSENMAVALTLVGAGLAGCVGAALAGGPRSVIGALCLVHVGKVLIVALTLKCIFGEGLERYLQNPQAVANVLLLGYITMAIAAWGISRWLTQRRRPTAGLLGWCLVPRPGFLFALGVSFFSLGLVCWVIGNAFDTVGNGLGVVRSMAQMRDIAPACFVFYAAAAGKRRIIMTPWVIGTACIGSVVGAVVTSKLSMVEGWIYIALAYYAIRGFRLKPFLLGASLLSIAVYFVIYPFAQVAKSSRNAGGLMGSSREMLSMAFAVATSSSRRQENYDSIEKYADARREFSYFGRDVGVLSRFAMIGEYSWLISYAADSGQQTGWETIIWAGKMLVPRFIMPSRPALSAAPYLASLVGVTASTDDSTNVSFGYMADLFCSGGYGATVLGGIVLPAFVFAFCAGVFGFSLKPNLGWVMGVGVFEHMWVESVISALVGIIYLPIFVALYLLLARWMYSITVHKKRASV